MDSEINRGQDAIKKMRILTEGIPINAKILDMTKRIRLTGK
jgi:hypothetical protein